MSTVIQALRPHRIRRFGEVLRQEGARNALNRARTHWKLLANGHGRGEIAAPTAQGSGGSRFALGGVWGDLAEKGGFHVPQAPALLSRQRSVALIGDLNLPQCRKYRVEQMDELWSTLGVNYRFAHYEDVPRCREILQHASHLVIYRLRRCDLVSMYLYEARRLGLAVMYDIDDPLFSVSAYATYENMSDLPSSMRQHFLDEAPLYLDVMNAADALTMSTPGLCDHAERYSSRPVFLRLNFADAETLATANAALSARGRKDAGFTVALTSGSRGHDADVDVARSGIVEFLRRQADRRLLMIGELDLQRFPEDIRGQIIESPFSKYEDYLRHLAKADCVLVPLADDPFNRCKSAVRAIDAAAVGVPAIVSDIGDLPHFVQDGQTGLVAPASGDWAHALESLADRSGSSLDLGQAARRALEGNWTARSGPPVTDAGLVRWMQE